MFEELDASDGLPPIELLPAPTIVPQRPGSWVCDGTLRMAGPSGGWEVDRVDLLTLDDKERIVIALVRRRAGSARPVALLARTFPSVDVRGFHRGAARPRAGRNTIGLDLGDGIRDDLSLRGFRPSGTRIVREISSYAAAGPSTRILVSVAARGCFNLRVPAWQGPNAANVRRARIILDVRR